VISNEICARKYKFFNKGKDGDNKIQEQNRSFSVVYQSDISVYDSWGAIFFLLPTAYTTIQVQ